MRLGYVLLIAVAYYGYKNEMLEEQLKINYKEIHCQIKYQAS